MHSKSYNSDQIEVLYRQHGAALLLFALSISGDRGRAQDVLHQVFLKLVENKSFMQAKDIKTYLFACVRNAALNHYKRENRSAPLDDNSLWFSPPERDYAAERNLRQALSELPQNQREVIVLHIWGELTFSEIGDLLRVSANTAASRYRYALERLRGSFPKEKSCAQSG